MTRWILITRTPTDCRGLREKLEPEGFSIRPFPVLRVEDAEDPAGWDAARAAVARHRGSAWLILTSPRAPGRFAAKAREIGADDLLDLPTAVVGPGTAHAAGDAGLVASVVGTGGGGQLAAELLARDPRPSPVVLATGRERRPELPEALTAAGVEVHPVVVYRMRVTPPRELPPLPPSVEAVVVTSPRAAELYLEGVGGRPLPCTHWALGPTTRDAARHLGIRCRIPPRPDLESLAEELCRT